MWQTQLKKKCLEVDNTSNNADFYPSADVSGPVPRPRGRRCLCWAQGSPAEAEGAGAEDLHHPALAQGGRGPGLWEERHRGKPFLLDNDEREKVFDLEDGDLFSFFFILNSEKLIRNLSIWRS